MCDLIYWIADRLDVAYI